MLKNDSCFNKTRKIATVKTYNKNDDSQVINIGGLTLPNLDNFDLENESINLQTTKSSTSNNNKTNQLKLNQFNNNNVNKRHDILEHDKITKQTITLTNVSMDNKNNNVYDYKEMYPPGFYARSNSKQHCQHVKHSLYCINKSQCV